MQFLDYGDGRSGKVSDLSGAVNTYATCVATAATRTVTTALVVAIGDQVLLKQEYGVGAGNWEIVRAATATSGGAFTTSDVIDNTYVTGAQAVKVALVTSGNLGSITPTAWNGSVGGGIIIIGNGPINIGTPFNVTGIGFRGSNANPGDGNAGIQGEGTGGTPGSSFAANGNGGSGGAGDASGPPGASGGGNATTGGTGNPGIPSGNSNTNPGAAAGSSTLTSMVMGGAGGQGGEGHDGSWHIGGQGGNGGGWAIIFAPSITTTASSVASGNTGGNGNGSSSGGAGGAGGSILFGGNSVSLGTSIAAGAGSGGSGSNSGGDSGGTGGTGSVGRIVAWAPSTANISGTTTPTLVTRATNLFAIGAQGFIA